MVKKSNRLGIQMLISAIVISIFLWPILIIQLEVYERFLSLIVIITGVITCLSISIHCFMSPEVIIEIKDQYLVLYPNSQKTHTMNHLDIKNITFKSLYCRRFKAVMINTKDQRTFKLPYINHYQEVGVQLVKITKSYLSKEV